MNRCERCPSFAINDDPDERLCDCCWRDEKLTTLKREVSAVCDRFDELAAIWGDEGHFRRCRDRLRKLCGEEIQ
jgi:hypothetical protein